MIQNILPSLIALLISLPLIFVFYDRRVAVIPKISLAFLYEIIYVILIFLPSTYSLLSIQGSSMNWSGKLLAMTFSIGFYLWRRNDFKEADFINIRPTRESTGKIVTVGVITIVSMCLLTFLFSKGKPLNVERLAYQATMPGLDEELWRGILLCLIITLVRARKFKLGHPAVWVTTLVFALGHSLYLQDWQVGFTADVFILTGILGYILGWVILKSRSVLPALILHNLINLSTNALEMLVL